MIVPRFSVVVPLYNKEMSIERTMRGILNQTFTDFELIIVDDGSTDSSVAKVKTFDDPRIHLVQQPNGGPSAARNTGVRHAKANWVVFLDADDELTSDALEYYNQMITAHPALDILDCNKSCRRGDTLTPQYHPIEGWVKNNYRACYFGKVLPGAGFSVFRKTVLKRCPYDERLRRFEDAELLIRLLDGTKVYSSRRITSIHDFNFAQASAPRKNIHEDYAAYLNLQNGSFWRRMCVYRTFLEERTEYPEQMRQLYPAYYFRYDLLLIYKILGWYTKFSKLWLRAND